MHLLIEHIVGLPFLRAHPSASHKSLVAVGSVGYVVALNPHIYCVKLKHPYRDERMSQFLFVFSCMNVVYQSFRQQSD